MTPVMDFPRDGAWTEVPAVRLRGSERAVTLYFHASGVVTIERSRQGRPVSITDGSIDWVVDHFFGGQDAT